MTRPRQWARRAMLSALAGGASLGGPFSAAALGTEAPTSTTPAGDGPAAPVTETTPQAPAPEKTAGEQPTATTPTPTTTTSTTTTPASTSPAAPAPAATTPATTPAPAPAASSDVPTVVVQRKQQTTRAPRNAGKSESITGAGTPVQDTAGAAGEATAEAKPNTPANAPAGAPNGVAPAPQAVGGEAGTLASLLAESAASRQALDFYRIPLFLLPIYQAAAIQYDVPWQILAAINEVETDYGTDQSVSTAGAVGWMQFMPQTWLMYGVDATEAGYADPYNPVDAIFAAARYLHAAGASKHLRDAILAYNHSAVYAESVLLRARLIASYPKAAIATLTGLVDGRAPTLGAHLAPGAVYLPGANTPGAAAGGVSTAVGSAVGTAAGATVPGAASSSATAGSVPASPLVAGAAAVHGHSATAHAAATVPGSTPPPPPQVLAARAAARARAAANAPAKPSQLLALAGKPGADVVAVQAGRVVYVGDTHALGRYLVLRDVYGDIFTYAGLGSIAPRYPRPRPPHSTPAGLKESTHDPAPTLPASAGHQSPLTLKVKAHSAARHGTDATAVEAETESEAQATSAGLGKVRLYAHPDNPLARAAAARAARSATGSGRWLPLRTGSLVAQGTVLGHLSSGSGPAAGQLRFAVRPADDSTTIDPAPLLTNWRQLAVALHPAGSKGTDELLGATAADVFPMSKSELQQSVLADPGVQLDACARRDVAAGAIDRRVLAVLEFLSRNGLQPTVSGLRCARARATAAGAVFEHFVGTAVDISAINGVPIAGHQGPGTVTDATIRTLLTLPRQLAPRRIISLMHYPEAPSTLARTAEWNHIHIDFGAPARQAHDARAAKTSPGSGGSLSSAEWSQLVQRIAALPQPIVAAKPSSSAIRDPQAAPSNRGLGAQG
jgi:membrane-bound lytic murein transglycosylase B